MIESESRGVQELALEPEAPARAVIGVAAHGMADRAQVHADLVRTAGLEAQPQQRRTGERALESEVRARASRPTGASIVPLRAGGTPSTSARYSR